MKRTFRAGVGLTIVAILLLTAAPPVAALTIRGEGHYARFAWDGGNYGGLVIVDREGGNKPRVTVAIVQTYPANEYDFYPVVGRSIGCGGTPHKSNQLFRATGMPDAEGEVFFTKRLSSSINFDELRSIWVRMGPDDPVCANAFDFEVLGVASLAGDRFVAIWEQDPATAIVLGEKRPNGRARVSIVVNGLDGNDTIRVIGSKKPCGQPSSGQNDVFKIFRDGAGNSIHDIHMNQGSLNALRSIRLRNISEGVNVGCAPLSVLIALLVP